MHLPLKTKWHSRPTNEATFQRELKRIVENKTSALVIDVENTKSFGQPDLLIASSQYPALFVELKYVRKNGFMRFENTQPLWYKKRMSRVRILICAYDSRDGYAYIFPAKYVVEQGKLVIALPKAESVNKEEWLEVFNY